MLLDYQYFFYSVRYLSYVQRGDIFAHTHFLRLFKSQNLLNSGQKISIPHVYILIFLFTQSKICLLLKSGR
jgi:hypothetical protein